MTGTTPGTRWAAACATAGQVWLFTREPTREPAVDWTNNVSERGAKAARRHQAVSGYWHTPATPLCRIRSYLDSATAHGLTALDAISTALAGKPWLPPLTATGLIAAQNRWLLPPLNGHLERLPQVGLAEESVASRN
jgi:hypothetical protein